MEKKKSSLALEAVDLSQIPKEHNLSGQRFGRLTVLPECVRTPSGARKWKCRCDCGTEKFILTRSLRSNATRSCGCLVHDRRWDAIRDLTGQRFGDLEVISLAEKHPKRRQAYWNCHCHACGNDCVVLGGQLLRGTKVHCGCKPRKCYTKKDITGKRFRMLTALYPTEKREHNGSVVWHCVCDCGTELDVSYNELAHGTTISCGCKKLDMNKHLKEHLTHVADTCVDILRSEKRISHGATGFLGVYPARGGRYRAAITFQRIVYNLGIFVRLEDAVEARQQAEQLLHRDFVAFYDRWSACAAKDPKWAEENPIEVQVTKRDDGSLKVSMLPELPDRE